MMNLTRHQARDRSFEIVGVVAHVNQWGLDSDDTQQLRAQLYLDTTQMPDDYIVGVPGGGGTFFIVRTDVPPMQALDSLRETAKQINAGARDLLGRHDG